LEDAWGTKEGSDVTNSCKTGEMVKAAKGQCKSVAELKKAISFLAVGEQVSWSHRIKGFEFPTEATQKEVKKAANEAKVVLRINDEE